MDSEIAVLVEQAASIATSGRWDVVNEAVEQWALRPKGKDEMWYGELFAALCFRVFYEYSALKEAYAAPPPKDDLALLSWRARNLLELSVWATFCAKGRNKARQFFEDLGRDAGNLLKGLQTWGEATNQSPDWFQKRGTHGTGWRKPPSYGASHQLMGSLQKLRTRPEKSGSPTISD